MQAVRGACRIAVPSTANPTSLFQGKRRRQDGPVAQEEVRGARSTAEEKKEEKKECHNYCYNSNSHHYSNNHNNNI